MNFEALNLNNVLPLKFFNLYFVGVLMKKIGRSHELEFFLESSIYIYSIYICKLICLFFEWKIQFYGHLLFFSSYLFRFSARSVQHFLFVWGQQCFRSRIATAKFLGPTALARTAPSCHSCSIIKYIFKSIINCYALHNL